MPQTQSVDQLYRTPLTPSYWRQARAALSSPKMLVFAALMVALTRALSIPPSIPIGHTVCPLDSAGSLAPWYAACAGAGLWVVEDILGFILKPTGEFFFGYTLSTMLGCSHTLCAFTGQGSRCGGLVLANLLVNLLVNAALGSVWTMMVRGGGYWGWFVPSLGKNLLTIVPKTILLYILYQALLPILRQMRIIPNQLGPKGLISFF